ncbi:MAG: ADP-ribosylglycohydrolase family protein [Planctomycetota bacterium]|nr:ADP-ribosylglycohydrolase family protein [Planctomycetota bacterium]
MGTERERKRGTLLGLAWGDAFGCPVEGWRKAEIVKIYGDYRSLPVQYPLEAIRASNAEALRKLRPLGLHSDDTQQALALLQVRAWSPTAWAEILVEGKRRLSWRGTGRNFNDALRKLAKGINPSVSGSASAGMGAAMRIAPLGTRYACEPNTLAQAAMESSLVTHGDIRAAALAYAVARAAALFVQGVTPHDVLGTLHEDVLQAERAWLDGHSEWTIDRTAGTLVSDALRELRTTPLSDHAALRERLSQRARPHLADGFTRAHPNQGFVLLGGMHALAMAFDPELNDPQAALAEIVRLGFDTDTVAAICGGLLGARFGTGWIPTERLLDRARLEAYADALAEDREPPENQFTCLEKEAAWTFQEKEFQKTLQSNDTA